MNPPEINQMGAPRSALLQLPQELRDEIYKHLLAKTFLVKNPCAEKTSESLPLRQPYHLAILRVSRSTYEEAHRVFHRHGRFRFNVFAARSPHLHEGIEKIPAISLLQDITLRLDVGAALLLGLLKIDFAAAATKFINHFASFDSLVPRKRCAVEIEFVLDTAFLLEPGRTGHDFRNALGRLTGFETVEVQMVNLPMRRNLKLDCLFPLYDTLNERFAMTLGTGKLEFGEEHFRLVYHPRRG